MNLILIILVLLLLFGGGGGYYYGGPMVGTGIGGLLLIVLLIYLFMGRRGVQLIFGAFAKRHFAASSQAASEQALGKARWMRLDELAGQVESAKTRNSKLGPPVRM